MRDGAAYLSLIRRAPRVRQEVAMQNTHAIAGRFILGIDLEYAAQPGQRVIVAGANELRVAKILPRLAQ